MWTLTPEERIEDWKANCTITPGGCWRYRVARGRPYSTYLKKQYPIARLMMFFLGKIDLDDKESQVNHKSECEYEDCINPDHLYVGCQKDNVRDSIENGTHHNWKHIWSGRKRE